MTSSSDLVGELRPRRRRSSAAIVAERAAAGPAVDDQPAPVTVPEPSVATAPGPTAAPIALAGPPVQTGSSRTKRRETAWPLVSLRILAALLLGFVAAVALVGPLQHARDQQVAFADFRARLAEATAPVGQLDAEGRLLALGTSVADLEIPGIGVSEVVGEGTTSGVLRSGPGHLRSTVLPGQAGTSVLLGRQAAYGGPFGRLGELGRGDVVLVRTGQGEHEYRVTGRRLEGDPLPQPLTAGQGRLTLVTAAGLPYAPDGVLRVDAELVSAPQPAPGRVLTAAALTPAERPLVGDSDALVAVVLTGQVLLLAVGAVTWARLRWGRRQAWVVGVPLVGVLGLATADQVARLLPNLL